MNLEAFISCLFSSCFQYLKEILKRFRMEECKPIGIPFNPKVKLQKNANGNDESKGFSYQ
jgi:hypothetical protein